MGQHLRRYACQAHGKVQEKRLMGCDVIKFMKLTWFAVAISHGLFEWNGLIFNSGFAFVGGCVESTTRVCLLSVLIRTPELGKIEVEEDEKEGKYSRADRRMSVVYDVMCLLNSPLCSP
jgi:hypothetical protein